MNFEQIKAEMAARRTEKEKSGGLKGLFERGEKIPRILDTDRILQRGKKYITKYQRGIEGGDQWLE